MPRICFIVLLLLPIPSLCFPAIYYLRADGTATLKTVSGTADTGTGSIRVQTSGAHGYIAGDSVSIFGVLGTTEANGTWTISYVSDTTHFDIPVTYINAWASGGTQKIVYSGPDTSATTCMSHAYFDTLSSSSAFFAAGDTFYLSDKGGVFTPPSGAYVLRIGISGSSGNPFSFDAAPGSRPVIKASQIIDSGSWDGPDDGVYATTLGISPYCVYEDDIPIPFATDDTCNSSDQGYVGDASFWYYSAGTIYYRPSAGIATDHVISYVHANTVGINANNARYWTVNGIDFRNCYYGIGGSESASAGTPPGDWTITNCGFYYCPAPVSFSTYTGAPNCTYNHNYIYRTGGGLEIVAREGTFVYQTNTDMSYNIFIDAGTIDGDNNWGTANQSGLIGDDCGVCGSNFQDSTFNYNIFLGGWIFAVNWYGDSGNSENRLQMNNNQAKYNYIANNYLPAFTIESHLDTSEINGTEISGNITKNCGQGTTQTQSGATFFLENGANSSMNYVEYNTFDGGIDFLNGAQSYSQNSFDYWTFRNNIILGFTSYLLHSGTHLPGGVFNYNLYYPAPGDQFYYSSGAHDWDAFVGLGYEANAPAHADPLFSPGSYYLQFTSPAKSASSTGSYIGAFPVQPSLTGSMTGVCQ